MPQANRIRGKARYERATPHRLKSIKDRAIIKSIIVFVGTITADKPTKCVGQGNVYPGNPSPILSTHAVADRNSKPTELYSTMANQSIKKAGTRTANKFARMIVLSGRFTSPAMNVMQYAYANNKDPATITPTLSNQFQVVGNTSPAPSMVVRAVLRKPS